MKRFAAAFCLFSLLLCGAAFASPFASEVTDSTGYADPNLYSDPASVLGKPHALNSGWGPCPAGPISMVEPSFGTDPLTRAFKIVTINADQEIIVKFDHPVVDDENNPFGIDLIVFGNPMFVYGGWANIPYDHPMNDPTSVFAEPVTVSVSPDGENWYTYENGPFADDLFPTQAVKMLPDGNFRDERGRFLENNFTLPVDPSLTVDDFGGITVYEADQLYAGSGGGTGYDLSGSGFDSIQYVRMTSSGGEIDAVVDVDPQLTAEEATPSSMEDSGDIEPGTQTFLWTVPEEFTGDVTYQFSLFYSGGLPVASAEVTGSGEIEATFDLDGNRAYELYVTTEGKTGLWQFHTANSAPVIEAVFPADGAEFVPTNHVLFWYAEDPDGEDMADTVVYFWDEEHADNWASCDITVEDDCLALATLSDDYPEFPVAIEAEKTYFWKLVVSDGELETSSEVFSFTTAPEGFADVPAVISGDGFDGLSMIIVSSVDLGLIAEELGLEESPVLQSTGDVLEEKVLSADVDLLESLHEGATAGDVVISFSHPVTDSADMAIFDVEIFLADEDLDDFGVTSADLTAGTLLDRIRPVKVVGEEAFDLVELAGDDVSRYFQVSRNGMGYSVRFCIAVRDGGEADVWCVEATRSCFVVNDGVEDGVFTDPIGVVSVPEANSGSGGGCNVGFAPAMGLLLIPAMVLGVRR